MIHKRIENREGFTLIEIVIAIAIVGFMMAAATIGFQAMQKRGRKTSVETSLKAIQSALNIYKLNVGVYPNSLKELIEKPTDPKLAQKWPGMLIEKESALTDPWGEPYHYTRTPGKEHPFELYTEGDPDEPQRLDVWNI